MKCWTNECYNMYCRFRDDEKYFLFKKQLDEYRDYEKNHLPQWYRDLSLHDNHIIAAEYSEDKLILIIEYASHMHPEYKICFYDFEVLENCDIVNSWIIANELYLEDNGNEFHLLVDTEADNKYTRAYYTVKFSKMEMIFNDLVCSLGDEAGDLLNPKSVDEIHSALYNEPHWYRNLSLYNFKVTDIEVSESMLNFKLMYDNQPNFMCELHFYAYEILNNEAYDIINYCVISHNLYANDNEFCFHLVEYSDNKGWKNSKVLSVKFKKLEMVFNDLVYAVGDGVDESLNSETQDLEQLFMNYVYNDDE